MTLDQRITDAARQVAGRVVVPEVDLEAVRSRARASRRQRVALAVTVIVTAIVVAGTALVGAPDTSAPEPVGPTELDGPPLTPYWHDGVLHVRDVEIETPWRRSPTIEVAGNTVLAGAYGGRGVDPAWALVDGDQLEPVPVPDAYPRLTRDGRIAYWWTYPTADSTRVVTWDTETNEELATRDLPGNETVAPHSYLAGIDDDEIAYWVNEDSDVPVTRWDLRADTIEPMPDLRPSDLRHLHAVPGEFFQNQFVSPDGTKEMFTGYPPGDTIMPPSPEIWVRPVGSEDPGDVVRLQVPESRYSQPLYDFKTHKGTLGAWWETNGTVLATVEIPGASLQSFPRTTLMRCSTTDGACVRIVELGDDGSGWKDWSFAHFPTAG